MNTPPILYLLMGLLFGTTLLAVGMALGFWMGKRLMSPSIGQSPLEQQQMVAALRNMASWTNDFVGDFTRYQSTMQSLTRDAADSKKVRTKEEVQGLLDRIVEANSQLQSRLESAEEKLDVQTKQLAGYLTEARTDGLTGLANRKAFDQKLDECYAKWLSTKQPFSMALVDIDHFKNINDTYGHLCGDEVLRRVAQTITGCLTRSTDSVARYGGEEFIVLLPHTNQTGAEHVAESIRKKVESLRLFCQGNEVAAQKLRVQVSIGVATAAPALGDESTVLFSNADQALYEAKNNGRNRVVVYS